MAIALCATAMLSGCATTGVVDTASQQIAVPSAETLAAGAKINVMAASPIGAKSLGKVSVTACQKQRYDPEPDDAYALALLKEKAAGEGATSLVGVALAKYNVSVTANCFTNIVATATAFR